MKINSTCQNPKQFFKSEKYEMFSMWGILTEFCFVYRRHVASVSFESVLQAFRWIDGGFIVVREITTIFSSQY